MKFDDFGTVDYGKLTHFIKHEGIYLFGGVTGISASVQKLNSDIYFFPIGYKGPKRWKTLETNGITPEPRFHHSQHYYQKGNYLVIYGGRRFANPEPEVHYDSEFVNQVCVLQLDSLEWSEVKFNIGMDRFPDLYNFSTAIMDDKLLVFGGMQGCYSQSKDMFTIQLPEKKTNYVKEEESMSADMDFFNKLNSKDDDMEMELMENEIL